MDIRFLGHACFTLSDGDTTLLIDPFLTGNPKAAVSADEVAATTILLTHGHHDHYGDTVDIAKRTGATVVAITEIAGEIEGKGVEVRNCNLGGTATLRLGLGQAGPGLAHLHHPRRHRLHPGRDCSSRSAARSSTTSATPACSPICSWSASAIRSTSR